MDTFFCIIKAVAGYLILMFASTNLLGMVVRGMRTTHTKNNEGDLIAMENISSRPSIIMTIMFSVISVLYLYALYHYWNIGVLLAGLILMLTRLPDLLFEMRMG